MEDVLPYNHKMKTDRLGDPVVTRRDIRILSLFVLFEFRSYAHLA